MKATPLAAIVIACLAIGCNNSPKQETLQSGDLLFVAVPMDYVAGDTTSMGGAIAAATGDGEALNYIHTAIIESSEDSVWIIDATLARGVDRYPLDSFLMEFTLKDGSYPTLDVMRLQDNSKAAEYVENAKKFIGQPYDVAFLPDNGAMYCTELVHESYVDADGSFVFSEAPMNFKNADGEFPPYWTELFGFLGMPIPQDVNGTNPQDMRTEEVLVPVEIDITSL